MPLHNRWVTGFWVLCILTSVAKAVDKPTGLWSTMADIGYWFYKDPTKPVDRSDPNCLDPKHWRSECGFVDPSRMTQLSHSAQFAFEQQQYHALLRDLSLNPGDVSSVLRWQRFNYWVVGQAMKAAYTAQFITTQHPEIDANVAHPFSRFGIALLKKIHAQKTQQWFQMLSKESLLVFFSRSDCPYCHAQAPLVQDLARKTHIALWNASLDAAHLPGFEHVMHTPDTLLPARILKVNTVPALFLYLPPDHKSPSTWIRLATGLTPEQTMQERIVQFVKNYRSALIQGMTLPLARQP